MPIEQEKNREFGSNQGHGQTMVSATDHGKLVTMASQSPFGNVDENARVLAKTRPSAAKKEKTPIDSHFYFSKISLWQLEFQFDFYASEKS